MKKVTIETDGTITGTILTVDGTDVTSKENVVSISLWATAPYVSKYSGEQQPGMVGVSYESAVDGKIERHGITSSEVKNPIGIGAAIAEDKVNEAIKHYLGKPADTEILTLVDKILDFAGKNKINLPSKEVLIERSLESLKDKAIDIGLKLE